MGIFGNTLKKELKELLGIYNCGEYPQVEMAEFGEGDSLRRYSRKGCGFKSHFPQ